MSEEINSQQQAENDPTTKGKSQLSLLILLLCIVCSAIGMMFYFNKNSDTGSNVDKIDEPNPDGTLNSGKKYMVYIRQIEVAPKKANGKDWDPRNSAPDIFYTLTWQNNQIYKSDTKKNALITEWLPVGVDALDSLRKMGVSLDQVISLPIVKYEKNDEQTNKLVFKISDDDWDQNDEIDILTVYINKLKPGDNVFSFTEDHGRSLRKVVIRVIDNSLSQNEKIQLLMGK
ncbi:MAG: hypothetical protein HRT88_09055 [Lentisphaeraceae bacterium]|nr:hypothetical protein [Lentisphaeraceae bacterium]